MKPLLQIAMLAGLLALSSAALAATRIVTLSVPGMNCPVCPITVKKALGRVPGVSAVDVHFVRKEVVVTFDDTKTNAEMLTKATADAGYPSTVHE